jgi:hypothetical protein
MHWENGLTFQCSGLMLRVPDEIGATPPFVLVPYTGFLLPNTQLRTRQLAG